jgi:hypothetical protein
MGWRGGREGVSRRWAAIIHHDDTAHHGFRLELSTFTTWLLDDLMCTALYVRQRCYDFLCFSVFCLLCDDV